MPEGFWPKPSLLLELPFIQQVELKLGKRDGKRDGGEGNNTQEEDP